MSEMYPRLVLAAGLVLAACSGGGDDTSSPDAATARCGDGTCSPGETGASCPADCSATCGDGTCAADETAASCPVDCDPTACTTAPDTCTGEDVCIASHCVSAFGRNYLIGVSAGMFPQFDDTGEPWDLAGGLPDPIVTVTLDGVEFSTAVIDDTLTPAWDYTTGPTLVAGGAVLRIDVYDSDPAVDDLAWSCLADPLTADLVRAGLRCAGTGPLAAGYVDMSFTPN